VGAEFSLCIFYVPDDGFPQKSKYVCQIAQIGVTDGLYFLVPELRMFERKSPEEKDDLNLLSLPQHAAEHLNSGATAKSVKMATGPL